MRPDLKEKGLEDEERKVTGLCENRSEGEGTMHDTLNVPHLIHVTSLIPFRYTPNMAKR